MTGGPGRLAAPRHGAGSRALDVIAVVENGSGARLKRSGRGSGVSRASFSAAC
jgi:hypothetical protein